MQWFTFHSEQKYGVPSFDKIPALGPQVREVHSSPGAWPSEILASVCICGHTPHFARIIPVKQV